MSTHTPEASMSTITTDPTRFEIPTTEQLRELRIICGLSVREAAERGGYSPTTIQRWEAGERSPRLTDVETLLEVYSEAYRGQQQFSVNR